MVKLPKSERAGQAVAEPVALVDILPTITQLTATAAPPHIDGVPTFGMAVDTTTSVEGGNEIDSRASTLTAYLGDYYGDFGTQIAQFIPKTAQALMDTVKKFEDFGFDELFLDPVMSDVRQVDLAADAVL